MSFSNLWDSFPKVTEYRAETKRLLDVTAAFIKEKGELDKHYAKGLERLSNSELFNFAQFSKPLSSLKKLIISQAKSLNRSGDTLILELAYSLKRLLILQEVSIKDTKDKAKKLMREKEKTERAYNKSKEKYHKQRRDGVKRTNTVKVLEHYRESYMTSIGELNQKNNVFIPSMNKILEFYQRQEEEKLSLLKDRLTNYVSESLKYTKEFKENSEALLGVLKDIQEFDDIHAFVDRETTGNTLNMVQFEDVTEEITEEPDLDLETFVDFCWNGERLRPSDFVKFTDLVSEHEGRLTWTNLVNKKRSEGSFLIPGESYSDLSCLISLVLDQMALHKDYRCALTIIILSQTFFSNLSGSKMYLEQLVKKHPIWRLEDIWEKLAVLAIEKEINSFAKFCLNEKDIGEDLPKQLQEIVISQLFSIIYIMRECEVPLENSRKLAEQFRERYSLPENTIPISF